MAFCTTSSGTTLSLLCRQGGLVEDKIVELQNSQWAKVVKVTESEVVLDANPMLAGLQRRLTIEVLGIERPAVPAAEG